MIKIDADWFKNLDPELIRLLKQLENQGKIKMHRNSLEIIDF